MTAAARRIDENVRLTIDAAVIFVKNAIQNYAQMEVEA